MPALLATLGTTATTAVLLAALTLGARTRRRLRAVVYVAKVHRAIATTRLFSNGLLST